MIEHGMGQRIVRMELKYCERCGGLLLRRSGEAVVYCGSCDNKLRELPPPAAPKRPAAPDREVSAADAADRKRSTGVLAGCRAGARPAHTTATALMPDRQQQGAAGSKAPDDSPEHVGSLSRIPPQHDNFYTDQATIRRQA